MAETRMDTRQAVIEQLKADARVNAENIDVLVNDGQVTLRGIAPSYRAKWAATEAARRVRGVLGVDNEMVVRPEQPSGDERIATEIRSALMRDADLDSSTINVDVTDGHVTLRGTVTTGWAKSRAEEDARWTRGVVAVSNQLTVVPTGSWQDRELAKEVEQSLRRDAAVDANRIDVMVQNRRVTLSGVVRNWAEREAALTDALHVRGVADVRDGLAVERRSGPSAEGASGGQGVRRARRALDTSESSGGSRARGAIPGPEIRRLPSRGAAAERDGWGVERSTGHGVQAASLVASARADRGSSGPDTHRIDPRGARYGGDYTTQAKRDDHRNCGDPGHGSR